MEANQQDYIEDSWWKPDLKPKVAKIVPFQFCTVVSKYSK